MLDTMLYPLRTVTGSTLPIAHTKQDIRITVLDESPAARALHFRYDFRWRATRMETVNEPLYGRYLPHVRSGGTDHRPRVGSATFPMPPGRPFSDGDPLASLFAWSKGRRGIVNALGRDLSVRLLLQLEQPGLVAGIAFSGWPFVGSRFLKTGENLGNFGLPREWRLTCAGSSADRRAEARTLAFLDAEVTASHQRIVSHSGYHFLTVDPTITDSLVLHLSDFPAFISPVGDAGELNTDEVRHGFCIPHLYVFEYREGARYRPLVSMGLVGGLRGRKDEGQAGVGHDMSASHAYELNLLHDDDGPHYVDFTAASALGSHRTYQIPDPETGKPTRLRECFVSDPVQPGESVTLFFEQGEEHARCLAGLKLFLPFVPDAPFGTELERMGHALGAMVGLPIDLSALGGLPRETLETALRELLALPTGTDFCERIRIRVWEVDPLDGVSPLLVPLDGPHATLLADQVVDELTEVVLALFLEGIRFKRPSTARWFAVRFENVDEKPGQFVVQRLEFVQSAHVSIHSMASRSRRVRALHYRLLGPDLARDYSALGQDGFNFSIERLVAGERKQVLFTAHSLLDLLQSGTARIYQNTRRRAVEDESSIAIGGAADNLDRRRSIADTTGWRRSRTGAGAALPPGWQGRPPQHPFETHSSQELRTHTEVLSPQEDVPEWKANAWMGNAMYSAFQFGTSSSQVASAITSGQSLDQLFLGGHQSLIPTYDTLRLLDGFETIWQGVVDAAVTNPASPVFRDRLKVRGMKTVNASPFGYNNLGKEIFELLEALSAMDPLSVATQGFDVLFPILLNAYGGPNIYALAAANSLGLSVNLAPFGLGLTLSSSVGGGLLLPSFSYVNSFGTQGTIARQAARTGSSVSQSVAGGSDVADTETSVLESRSRRQVSRSEVDGTDAERVRGAEVLWQDRLVDIVTGTVPLDLVLPATAGKSHFRTADDTLRVRMGGGVGRSLVVDFWFEVLEEVVRDDY